MELVVLLCACSIALGVSVWRERERLRAERRIIEAVTGVALTLDVNVVDALIRFWRKKHREASSAEYSLLSAAYIDAYQSIRRNHGLPNLGDEEPNADAA